MVTAMQVDLVKIGKKGAAETIQVSDTVFDCSFNESLVHQLVTAYQAGGRQGTHAQKNRAAVRGGGKKPWGQKGTGQARAGTIRSPLWRKGGITFAAQPQDYSQKINKKMYRGAMRAILSELIRQQRLLIVNEFSVATPKTKDLAVKLQDLSLDKVMLVLDAVEENLYLAARNLPGVAVCDVAAADPVSLINFPKILMTVPALRQFEENLA